MNAPLTTNTWIADFETARTNDETDPTKMRVAVWLWCAIKLDTREYKHGHDVKSFFAWLKSLKSKQVVYFHNLKYDGSYLLSYMLSQPKEFHDVGSEDHMKHVGDFYTFIDDRRAHYFYRVMMSKDVIMEIRDSLKIIPVSVRKMGGYVDNEKGSIDYDKPRDTNYKHTLDELRYCFKDCEIVRRQLDSFFHFKIANEDIPLTKLTVGGNAINIINSIIFNQKDRQNKHFNQQDVFPALDDEVWQFCKRAYAGAICMVNPRFRNREVRNIKVFDATSMYPSKQACVDNQYLPYGKPCKFLGKPNEGILDKHTFIIHIKASLSIKDNRFPCLHKGSKFGLINHDAEFLYETDKVEDLYFSQPEWELVQRQYDITDLEYIDGYYFKKSSKIFTKAILSMFEFKKQAEGALRLVYKLHLNASYGKYGQGAKNTQSKPRLEDEVVRYDLVENNGDSKELSYIPVALFITAWGRVDIIDAMEKNHDRFIYCDTDSVHMFIDPTGKYGGIWLDDEALGAFKDESKEKLRKLGRPDISAYPRAVYLRAKTYAHADEKGEIFPDEITCAGLNTEGKNSVKWLRDWNNQLKIPNGKTRALSVKGGTYISSTSFKFNKIPEDTLLYRKGDIIKAVGKG